ncbi:hypothetical protein WG8_0688, partial [Paenibacillus sp. Aloe-11]
MQEVGIEWDANTPNEDFQSYLRGPRRPSLLSWVTFTYAQDADKFKDWRDNEMGKKTIVIDAGHGAKDPGALGPTGKKEKDFNLTMAIKVEAFLKDNPELKVVLTRRTDVFLELKERVSI